MATRKMTVNRTAIGASGKESYRRVIAGAFRGKLYVRYEYTHTDGTLFSTTQPILKKCRERRDSWLLVKYMCRTQRQEIRQDGLARAWSGDGISMAITFGNLTGAEINDPEEYRNYVQSRMGYIALEYGVIELVADGVTVARGTIRENL
jgi:hypothetical protein